MSKRFTETEIWEEDWFIEMPKEYKLFYFFLKDQCNHAGIWRPNLRIFEAINEVKIDLKKAAEYFNKDKERVQILASGHWYLLDFFVFQYGRIFNCSNRVHESIQNIYNKEDIKLTSIRGLLDHKDRVKDKDKDKDIDKDKEDVIDNVINYNGVLENFHLYCDRMSKVSKLSDARKGHISARFKEFDYDTIIEVLKRAGKSDFLCGINPKAWKADFDWIFLPTNFLKIMEGKYDNKAEVIKKDMMP